MKMKFSYDFITWMTLDCLREKSRHLLWFFVTLSVILGSGGQASGQNMVIRGRITGTDGMPLPGVNISVKGTLKGVVSNSDGAYSLEVPGNDAILHFSFIGYEPQDITVGTRNIIDIVLKEELKAIDEVVIVGYGTQRRKDLTGSISSVSGDEIIQPSTVSFDQMLQGKVAGVQISQTTGAPGGNVNVLIRGVSSITGGNQPLYVVDGYPIGSGGGGSNMMNFGGNLYTPSNMSNATQNRINPLSSINPSDIQSIEILKDASATAIYGSRGANGVIIITTRRGSIGRSDISFDVSYGVQEIAHKLDLMDAREYAQYVTDARDNAWVYAGGIASDPNEKRTAATRVRPEFRNPGTLTTNTDWQDVIFRIAPVQSYQVSVNSGTGKTNFFISGGYFDQKGIILTSTYKRFSIRSNIDSQISDRFKVGTSISGSYGYGRFPNTEGHYASGGILTMAIAASPTIPVYDENGNYYFNQADVTDGLGWLANPLAVLDGYSDNRKVADILFNNYLEYKLMEGLYFKSSFGVKYGTNVIKLWRSSVVPFSTTLNYPSTAGVTKSESIDWLNENILSFKHAFKEKHFLDALAGFTAQKNSFDRLSAGASDFPTDYVTYLSAGIVNAGTHYISEWSILSLMARLNYSYDGKYLFTATLRRDGSSKFGANKRWGTFPSFSVGYNISEEPFMKSLDFISNLKIRASYGYSGNNQIGNYSHIGLLSSSAYVVNNNKKIGLVPSSLSNDDLTWEKSQQSNLGIELGLFEDRIMLSADVYKNLKTDLLLAVELPAASGFSSSTQNVGDIENKGFELLLQTVNFKGKEFQWISDLTFSTNKNEVLKLASEGARIANSSFQITQVGYPLASFYLLNNIGVFMNSSELAGAALQHPKTQAGDPKFEDVNSDGVINSNDKKIVGDPWPDYTWGFDNTFTYGNFSLRVFLNGSQGSKTYLNSNQTILNSAGVQNQIVIGKRWRSESEPGDGVVPRAIRNNYAYGFGDGTDYLLFNSSYVRIKNVNLSYNFPKSIISKLALKNLSAYIDVSNLYTFTDYPGYDPESSTSGDNIIASGIDYMTYPLSRTYTFGLKLTF